MTLNKAFFVGGKAGMSDIHIRTVYKTKEWYNNFVLNEVYANTICLVEVVVVYFYLRLNSAQLQ